MCGIAGEIRFDDRQASAGRVARMTDTMSDRGPDDDGMAQHGWVAFGHRRLKIVDLSDRAAQPMRDRDTGCVIVFNGCVYNHDELRAELVKAGHRFYSKSDTEVILRGYSVGAAGSRELNAAGSGSGSRGQRPLQRLASSAASRFQRAP